MIPGTAIAPMYLARGGAATRAHACSRKTDSRHTGHLAIEPPIGRSQTVPSVHPTAHMFTRIHLRFATVVLPLMLLSCGAALQLTGAETAEGAVAGIEEELRIEGQELLTERLAARAARGAVDGLSNPEQLREIARILAASGAGALEGAAGIGFDGDTLDGAVPIEQVSAQAAEAIARALAQELIVQLGPQGDGPLTRSISAAVNDIVAAAVIGIPHEALIFPECRGENRQRCIEQRLGALSRAATAGATRGAMQAVDVYLLLLGVLIGLVLAVLGLLLWNLLHAHHGGPAGHVETGRLQRT